MITITIPQSVVSKKNSKQVVMIGGKNCPRRPMILPSKAYKVWEKQARKAAWGEIVLACSLPGNDLPSFPLTCPIHIEAHFYYKGNQPDLSGACESVGDMGEGVLWADDGQIRSWDNSRLHHSLKNPRTEITIRYSLEGKISGGIV